MSRVTVAGGGIAGITAALRLAERGYDVTLYEEQPVLGGNMSSRAGPDGVDHDVYPHMYLNWYHNFWKLLADVSDVPRDEMFVPISSIKRLVKGDFPRFTALTDTYSVWHAIQNLFSGVAPPPDMFLFMYASIDLLAERLHPTVMLDELSVNGFLHARPYMTERVAEMFNTWTTLVWSIPSYLTSADDYRTFLEHGYAQPVPALWLLRGCVGDRIIGPVEDALVAAGAEIHLRTRVTGVSCADGRIAEITVRSGSDERTEAVDDLVLAVPPPVLSRLIRHGEAGRRIVDVEPSLAHVARLRTEAMPMVELVFTRRLRNIPPEPVSLVGSRYCLGFTDVSDLRGGSTEGPTVLALSSSDRYGLPGTGPRDDAMAMIRELATYVTDFEVGTSWGSSDDIDWKRTTVDLNTDTRLFVNETGSDFARPRATCPALPNLFLAGDFCDNHIGLTCVEAAVVTGLNAARAVVDRRGRGAPVEVIAPRDFPAPFFAWLRMVWAPYAAAAKVCADAGDRWRGLGRRADDARSALRYLFTPSRSRRQR